MKFPPRRALALQVAVLSILASQSAMSADPAPAPGASRGLVLDEVLVTARKREEKLQDVPISITSVTSEDLEKQGIADVATFVNTVPGVNYAEQRDRNSGLPGIRGVKSTEISPNRQKVSTFYDGKPVLGNQSVAQFTDVERIEVYRGPQSSQFGRAVFGGAFNYISTPVDLTRYSGTFSATLGSEDVLQGSALLTGPIMEDKLGFLVAASLSKAGGAGQPVSSDGVELGNIESEYLSGKITYRPVEWMTATLRHQYLKTDDGPSTTYWLDYNDPRNVLLPGANANTNARAYIGEVNFTPPATANDRLFCFGGSTVARIGAAPPPAASSVFVANCIDDPHNSVVRNRTSLDLDFDLPNQSVLSVSGFKSTDDQERFDANSRSTLPPYFNTALRTYVNTIQHEFAVLSNEEKFGQLLLVSPGTGRFRYTAGYSYYKYDFLTYIYNNYSTLTIQQIFAENTKNQGLFGSAQVDVTDWATLSLEARQQQEDFNSRDPRTGASYTLTTKTFLPRAAVSFKISPTMTAYLQVAKDNNPAGVNIDTQNPTKQAIATATSPAALNSLNGFLAFDEETIWNYEIGLKGSLLDRRLTFEAALFKYNWTDYTSVTNFQFATQGSQPTISTQNADYQTRVFYNAGDVDGQGLELSGSYRVTQALTANLSYSYGDTEFASGCSPNITKYGLPLAGTTPAPCVDVKGKKVPLLSSHSVSGGLNLTTPLTAVIDWSNRVDVQWFSKQYVDEANLGWIGDRSNVNFRSTLTRGPLSVSLFVNNLTDNDNPGTVNSGNNPYLLQANQSLTLNGGNRLNAVLAAPRRYGLQASYRF